MLRRRSATARSVGALALAAVSVFALAACGSSSSSSSASSSSGSSAASGGTSTSATVAASTTSGSCGTLPSVPANDPNGLIPALGSGYPANYEGFTDFPVAKSPWINWKPAHKSGWNVQVVWTPLNNPFTNTTLNALKQQLMASGKVSTIGVQAPAAFTDVPQQLQEIGTAIQRKPDILIVFPLAPPPTVPLIAQAAKAGIPTISAWTLTPSKYAVSFDINPYQNEGLTAAGALKLMGGKGDVLEVHGIPGTGTDADASAAWAKALSVCPNVHVAGTVAGQFVAPVAKGLVQQFIATHPSGVQGVFQAGTMGVGVLGAFQQTGHKPPPMADPGTAQGVVAYWHGHSDYDEVATATDDLQIGQAGANIALRMLEGQGVKVNAIVEKPYLVTRANLGQVWMPSFTEGSLLDAPSPPGTFIPASYLNAFFQHPATP